MGCIPEKLFRTRGCAICFVSIIITQLPKASKSNLTSSAKSARAPPTVKRQKHIHTSSPAALSLSMPSNTHIRIFPPATRAREINASVQTSYPSASHCQRDTGPKGDLAVLSTAVCACLLTLQMQQEKYKGENSVNVLQASSEHLIHSASPNAYGVIFHTSFMLCMG